MLYQSRNVEVEGFEEGNDLVDLMLDLKDWFLYIEY